MARRLDIDCQAEIPADPPRFLSDATKMRQILINLLSNAVKFTPAGKALASVERLPEA